MKEKTSFKKICLLLLWTRCACVIFIYTDVTYNITSFQTVQYRKRLFKTENIRKSECVIGRFMPFFNENYKLFSYQSIIRFFWDFIKKKQIKFVYDPKVIGTALNKNQFDKSNLSTICVNYCKVQFKKKTKNGRVLRWFCCFCSFRCEIQSIKQRF